MLSVHLDMMHLCGSLQSCCWFGTLQWPCLLLPCNPSTNLLLVVFGCCDCLFWGNFTEGCKNHTVNGLGMQPKPSCDLLDDFFCLFCVDAVLCLLVKLIVVFVRISEAHGGVVGVVVFVGEGAEIPLVLSAHIMAALGGLLFCNSPNTG